ncbi:MAG: hypothetical protein JEZ09_18170 [Salinivirgaceae bacterium]|nr:hypothetical protein [Salinivirgaceae bacterium]
MIYQPIEQKFKPSKEKENAISLEKFLELLTNEEDYFRGKQHQTKLMITRLRKIFYAKYGWDSKLIRGAAKTEGRYEVKLVPCGEPKPKKNGKEFEPAPKCREVLVKKGDWMNPNAGTVPEIFTDNNQQVILPDGLYCDLGHVLAGVDAYNYFAPVTPLPKWLMCLKPFFPLVDSNVDIVTWLGDIASSAGEFLYKKLENKRELSDEEIQKIIDEYAPGPDMLGDIDPYVICEIYNTKANDGLRPTEMFKDYYDGNGMGSYYRKRRCQFFSTIVGLNGWDGENFSNEKAWIKYYLKQLRNNDAFYLFSRCENFKGLMIALIAWIGCYKHTLRNKTLLQIFVKSLKSEIKSEPKL